MISGWQVSNNTIICDKVKIYYLCITFLRIKLEGTASPLFVYQKLSQEMELNQKIKEMAAKGLQNPSHFVVDVSVSKYKPTKITVFVDGDQGISIDDCANLSRLLAEQLDEQDLIKEAYTLEVSTPGIDHPLKLKRQYLANIGRNVKVQLTDKELLRGKLMNADEQKIILETQNKEKNKGLMTREILFTDIEKTIVTVSFN